MSLYNAEHDSAKNGQKPRAVQGANYLVSTTWRALLNLQLPLQTRIRSCRLRDLLYAESKCIRIPKPKRLPHKITCEASGMYDFYSRRLSFWPSLQAWVTQDVNLGSCDDSLVLFQHRSHSTKCFLDGALSAKCSTRITVCCTRSCALGHLPPCCLPRT